jgi:NAD(P)H dehydrogenase (quinone)
MHVLLVVCHPEPKSFTHALMHRACEVLDRQGITYDISDLYAEGFNPAAGRHDFKSVAREDRFHYQTEQKYAAEHGTFSDEITREQDRVRRANVMIFFFPLWGGGMPAMLKGWFERVMAYGFSYVDGRRYGTGLFKGRAGMLCLPTGGTRERFSAAGSYGNIEDKLRPLTEGSLAYLGLDVAKPYVAFAAPRVSEEERLAMLDEWGDYLSEWMAERVKTHPDLPDLHAPVTASAWDTAN